MADDDYPLEAQSLDHRLDVGGQTACRPGLAVLARLTMPGLIEGDDAVVGCKHIDLVLPVLVVAAPAVQKDKGRVALAANLADEVHTIVGPDGFLNGLGVGFAGQCS